MSEREAFEGWTKEPRGLLLGETSDHGDFRIDTVKDASVHWRGRGRIIHLPTGLNVAFEYSWNDKSDREAKMQELRRLIERGLRK